MTAPTPDPGTAREAAERVRALNAPRNGHDGRTEVSDQLQRAIVAPLLAEAYLALSAKVEAVQAVRLAMHADVFPGPCDRVGVLGAYLADLDAALGSS